MKLDRPFWELRETVIMMRMGRNARGVLVGGFDGGGKRVGRRGCFEILYRWRLVDIILSYTKHFCLALMRSDTWKPK